MLGFFFAGKWRIYLTDSNIKRKQYDKMLPLNEQKQQMLHIINAVYLMHF